MLPPFLGLLLRFLENVKRNCFSFGTWPEEVKVSGDITSHIRSTRISKMSPFAALDLQLANWAVGKPLKDLIFNLIDI